MLKSFLVLALAAGSPLLLGQDCVGVRGMGQAVLPTDKPLNPDDGWGGTVYLNFDNGETLAGVFSGVDGGTVIWRAHVGNGKQGSYTFAFNGEYPGYLDTFTTEVTNAIYPVPNGHLTVGVYQASHKIVRGTGRFVNATGTIFVRGTWMGMLTLINQGASPIAFWNPEITGSICNVLPAAK